MEPAAQNAIDRLSHRHEMIINWLILNPDRPLSACAAHFGYTQAWLSQIIHSDIFQAKLRQRQERIFDHVAAEIPEKLNALGHAAIDKLGRVLDETADPKLVLDTFDKVLHRLGYAPKTAKSDAPVTINQQANVYVVDPSTLALARQSIVDRSLNPTEVIDASHRLEERLPLPGRDSGRSQGEGNDEGKGRVAASAA